MAADRVRGPGGGERLLALRGEEGSVVASRAAARLGVSLDTIRRDLDELAGAGALRRVHGGALPASPSPRRFVDRPDQDVGAKRAIARAARGLIADGQVVVLGGGTTLVEPTPALPAAPPAAVPPTAPP